MVYYTIKHVQDALKKANLPFSRMFLLPLQMMGIIRRPDTILKIRRETKGFSTEDMRIYTEEDIRIIVQQVAEYKKIQSEKYKTTSSFESSL